MQIGNGGGKWLRHVMGFASLSNVRVFAKRNRRAGAPSHAAQALRAVMGGFATLWAPSARDGHLTARDGHLTVRDGFA